MCVTWEVSATLGGNGIDGRPVERLSGLDAAFLALETAATHLHVGAVMVFAPGEAGLDFEVLRQMVLDRLHLVPPFRRRAVRVPFGLHHPLWLEDPEFDIDYHLRRASLPGPGGLRELTAFVADQMGRPLDPDRPLWEMHMVEGLDSGHVALIAKIHHAMIDGVSGAELLRAFFDLAPDGECPGPPAPAWSPERVPGEVDLVLQAVSSLVRQPEAVVSTLRETFHAAVHLAERRRRIVEEDELDPPPAPFGAPRTSLNGSISPHRRFSCAESSLDQVRNTARLLGATVNDVVLAAVGGALRRLLVERGEKLADSLVAMVPVSTRSGGDQGGPANRVSAMLVSLATDVESPEERLAVIAQGSRLAKQDAELVTGRLIAGWAGIALPAVSARAARLVSNLRVFDHLPPVCNVVVSNVAGPDIPLWCAGGRLVAVYPVGPVADGVGLNVTVFSYMGQLFLGLLGCRELVPEISDLAIYIVDSLAELDKAARRAAPRHPYQACPERDSNPHAPKGKGF